MRRVLGLFISLMLLVSLSPYVALAQPDLVVDQTSLEWGPVQVGQEAGRTLHVTNQGNATAYGLVTFDCEDFGTTLPDGYWHCLPGQSVTIVVVFSPSAPGEQLCEMDLGVAGADPVALRGTGTAVPTDPDVIGVYFQQTGVVNQYTTTVPYEEVTAYLLIVNPTATNGIRAWECCIEVVGNATNIEWELGGDAFSLDTPPCFATGITGYPLLGEYNVILATVRFVQPSPDEATYFYVHPATRPTLPGTPCYVDDREAGEPIPLNWSSGEEGLPVAKVNDTQTAAFLQSFEAERGDSGVTLSWEVRGLAGDAGLRLWRQAADGSRVQVSPGWLSGSGSFVDTGAPADEVEYWLQVRELTGTEYWLGSARVGPAAALAEGSRLLPNAPNPFNPSTDLYFELLQPGRASLKMYDTRGRLLAVLVDGERPQGRQSVHWDGRDAQGRILPSGSYIVRLVAEDGTSSLKVILAR